MSSAKKSQKAGSSTEEEGARGRGSREVFPGGGRGWCFPGRKCRRGRKACGVCWNSLGEGGVRGTPKRQVRQIAKEPLGPTHNSAPMGGLSHCHAAEMSCETGLLVILLLMTLQVLIDLPFYS